MGLLLGDWGLQKLVTDTYFITVLFLTIRL